MKWHWLRRSTAVWERASDQQRRLDDARAKARELEARGEKVAAALNARHKRNHWGETVSEIARGL